RRAARPALPGPGGRSDPPYLAVLKGCFANSPALERWVKPPTKPCESRRGRKKVSGMRGFSFVPDGTWKMSQIYPAINGWAIFGCVLPQPFPVAALCERRFPASSGTSGGRRPPLQDMVRRRGHGFGQVALIRTSSGI